jgi:large subunit ribosomal protein L15
MDLSTLQYLPGARRSRKRIGRGPGSGHGKTAGRGTKGQKARSGYSRRRGFEGGQMPLFRRLPKRGFHHRNRFPYAVVNVDVLDKAFEAGAVVTPEAIVAAGLASAEEGGVKVLGRGEITRKLTVRVNEVSPTARAKIEAAGGVVEILGIPTKAAPKEQREGK